MKTGTKFIESKRGYTVSGYGETCRHWEIVEVLPDSKYLCRLLHDDNCMKTNTEYTEVWTEGRINATKY